MFDGQAPRATSGTDTGTQPAGQSKQGRRAEITRNPRNSRQNDLILREDLATYVRRYGDDPIVDPRPSPARQSLSSFSYPQSIDRAVDGHARTRVVPAECRGMCVVRAAPHHWPPGPGSEQLGRADHTTTTTHSCRQHTHVHCCMPVCVRALSEITRPILYNDRRRVLQRTNLGNRSEPFLFWQPM